MKSATQLGKMIGKSAREVNELLKAKGYIDGTPGNYSMTEAGREHGEIRFKDNGYGGYAARAWSFMMWNDEVAYEIDDPDAWKEEVNRNRKAAGLDPIEDF